MTVPTKGEAFSKLLEHLRLAQEESATLAHLHRDDSRIKALGWLTVTEALKKMINHVTALATKGLQ